MLAGAHRLSHADICQLLPDALAPPCKLLPAVPCPLRELHASSTEPGVPCAAGGLPRLAGAPPEADGEPGVLGGWAGGEEAAEVTQA